MSEKLSQGAVRSQGLEKGGLESRTANQNIDGDAVVKNFHTMPGVWRNDSDISGL